MFLFSVDLEDIRSMFDGGHRYPDRVGANTARYVELLARRDMRCTFFTVGDVARRHPELLRDLRDSGHEIACHTSDHVPLDEQTPASLRDDLRRCRDDFARAGVDDVVGFRAPSSSLVARTAWAYEVLAELGFRYSSSVAATRGPLYGWPDFGADRPRRMGGVWELPISLCRLPGVKHPFCSGVYFRVLPFPLVRALFARRAAAGEAVVGYFHPYDVDTEQERFMHPQIGGRRLYNWLMYRNRGRVLDRLERLMETGARVVPYRDFVGARLDPSLVAAA